MNTQGVRDFIYVDIDRVKSIMSQLEEGLIDQSQTIKGRSGGGGLDGEGGFIDIIKGKANLEMKFHRQISETKSMHDFIYNKVERKLLKENKLIKIPYGDKQKYSLKIRDSIGNTSFILAKGRISINDFSVLKKLLENWEELSTFIARCTIIAKKDTISYSEAETTYNELVSNLNKNLNKETREGFLLMFDMFYNERVIIKLIPFREYPDFRLVGNLDKQYLRENIEGITYKYSTSPYSDWTIFGQVASLPPKEESNKQLVMTGSPIENALHGLFNTYRVIERTAQTVTYPEIAITPIAIYRE